jgi:predicted transcriptional regulator
MSHLVKTRQVLNILAKNLKNPQPQVVYCEHIAIELEMSVKETSQLLKIMHAMGVVISDAEGQKALITQKGMNCMDLYRG